MSKEKQIEVIIDLLTEFDEMGFVPTTTVPKPEVYAIKWRDEMTKAIEEYRKQSEGEWTSVRERLPEESGMYLVFTYRGNRAVLDYSERHKIFNSFDSFSTEEANEVAIAVTHWMPLPEPPKGD